MGAEGLAGVHVGEMHLDEGDADGEQRIAQGHAGMVKAPGLKMMKPTSVCAAP